MATMRQLKQDFNSKLSADRWRDSLGEIAAQGMAAVGPLFALLPRPEPLRGRAAHALGLTVAKLYESSPENARIVIRRLMWHMNEESGNIGWGIPEAFGESLAACPGLAKEYHRVLISYIASLGGEDNFCDHAILRADCYRGIGIMLKGQPQYANVARPWLAKGLEQDEDQNCREQARLVLDSLPGPGLADLRAAR